MIADAIEFMRREVRDHLGVADDEVIINSARKLTEDANPPGAYISVVNVQRRRPFETCRMSSGGWVSRSTSSRRFT